MGLYALPTYSRRERPACAQRTGLAGGGSTWGTGWNEKESISGIRHRASDSLTSSFPIVHAVSDSGAVTSAGFLDRARAIMKALGPRGALHLRSSRTSVRRFHDLAVALARIQDASGCWLILNDRVDVALAAGARGAQLASHSISVEEALAVAPSLLIGASIHSVDEALAAEAAGAAWCVAGTVFETPSHAGRTPARIEFVEAVTRAVRIPVIAIG